MNTKFQLLFLTKYYNKRQIAVNIHFSVSSKSGFCLLKSSTWHSRFHVTLGSGSTEPQFKITTSTLLKVLSPYMNK